MPPSPARRCVAPLAGGFLVAAGLVLLAGAAPAAAATRVVTPTPAAPCAAAPARAFSAIQAAVDASQAGDRVLVCPGTYEERVVVGVDRLEVVAATTHRATIRPPALDLGGGAVVTVTGALGAQVRRFVVTGPAAELCPAYDAGIWVRDGATATVSQNRLPGTGCAFDTGIRFGSAAEPTAGGGLAQRNVVSGMQTTGLAATEGGSEVSFAANSVSGTPTGVEVAFGARGVVQSNEVSGTGTGIRLFLPAAARNVVGANTVLGSGRAIDLVDVDRSRVSANRVRANDEGIVADATTEQTLLEHNQARGNATVDCLDESTGGFGTAGTSNTWRGNRGAISAPPGICLP